MKPAKLLVASWCNTCQPIKRYIDNNNLKDIVSVMDVDENPRVAMSCGIRGVPSLVLHTGDVISGPEKILNYIKENYDAAPDA